MPIVMVGRGAGCGTGDTTDYGSDHRSLAMSSCGPDQGSCGSTAPYNGGGPAIMAAPIVAVVVHGSAVDGRGLVNGCLCVAVAIAAVISGATIVIAPIIPAPVAIPSVVVPITIAAVVGSFVPHSSAVVTVLPVLRRHCWNATANKRRDDGDRCVVSNAFHNFLRI
jgi:hypothetical protein